MKLCSILVLFVCFTVSIYADRNYGPEDCSKPASVPRLPICPIAPQRLWRWDVKSRSCVRSLVHGCYYTKNNFSTEDECNKVAKPICAQLLL
ncbi:unnamed protein product [Diabrotica balteata]|uniref:BPTI/Kunitz inhibitor domain-containing protein n=1 Tax=Diabrotica balteata TaxID=107213 RepID=A0A9N9XC88_DIABA|nr:unnamed protein product [Diabrotica balteata]